MKKILSLIAISIFALGVSLAKVEASHSWGNYHWARTSNPFTLITVDSVTSTWDATFDTALSDWTQSSILDLAKENGLSSSSERKRCRPFLGKIRACNFTYGNNGWLGIAQIWITGGTHIAQGVVKLNDTYFNTSTYNNTAWRNLVMCQEIGHTFGLDHQDENFKNVNLGTCMDYSNNPLTNQHPNAHDYDELLIIYSHLDTSNTIASFTQSAPAGKGFDIDTNDPREWGRLVRESTRASVYERELGGGERLLTHVFWAEEDGRTIRSERSATR